MAGPWTEGFKDVSLQRAHLIYQAMLNNFTHKKQVGPSSDHAGASLDNSRSFLGPKNTAEAGDGTESVQLFAFRHGDFRAGLRGESSDGHVFAGRYHFTVECIDMSVTGICGRASGVWRLVDVFAVNVDCIRLEGGSAIATTGIALLKAEELQFGLDSVDEALAHDG
uniref:Uncharacterized protein n=1 Tax=Photinus pyralis TaxID=7054 RepID=A0A1Y1LPK7_PHOPY